MAECRDFEPLFAPFAEGESSSSDRTAVESHLNACPPCRERVARERAALEVVRARRGELQCPASDQLRRRCAALQTVPEPAPVARPRSLGRRTLLPLSLAASIALAVGGVFFFGFNQSVEVFAAQLAADHLKCFQFPPAEDGQFDPVVLSRDWMKARGWPITIPASAAPKQLELLGMRRCGSTEGITAHLMYKWRGQPLSVYVLNGEAADAGPVEHIVETLGQEAIVWTKRGRTYAVVARGLPAELQEIAQYVRQTAE